MIVVPDFVVGFRELLTALPTRRRDVIVCLLCVCQRRHVLVVGKDGRYYLTFFHDVFVEFIRYLWSTVYDGVGLVFGIFSDAVASKATHVVLVDRVGGLYGIDVFVVVERCEKRLEIAN